MLATDRRAEIEVKFSELVSEIRILDLDGETLRLILYFNDGRNLRRTEQWHGGELKRYGYYWLSTANELKIGRDNAPHHHKIDPFPHHKHVERQKNIQPSEETTLEEVIKIITK